MRSARYTSSPSPRAATSSDASPIPSEAVSEMNISTTTGEDNGEEELSTTPTGPSYPIQARASAAPRSVSSQEDGKGKRPRLAHRISVGSGPFGVNIPSGPSSASPYARRRPSFAPASLPSQGWAGDSIFNNVRSDASIAPTVSPQHDYLANWESLQDLVMPTPEGSSRYRSPSSRRRDPSPGVSSLRAKSAYGALGTTPGRGTFGRAAGRDINRVPSVTETDEEDEEAGVSSYSAVLSSSPPNLDAFGAAPSFGTAGEQMASPDVERPSVCTPARPVTPSPAPTSQGNPPGGATPSTPAAAGSAKKTGMFHSDTRR